MTFFLLSGNSVRRMGISEIVEDTYKTLHESVKY